MTRRTAGAEHSGTTDAPHPADVPHPSDLPTGPVPAGDAGTALPPHALLVVAALAAGVVAQGGYYPAARVLVAALALGSAILALLARPRNVAGLCPVVAAAGGLAGWALARAVAAGTAGNALPWIATLAGLLAGLVAAWRSPRVPLALAMVAIGALAAVAGWVGAALRIRPWGEPVQGVWRAAGTLTYANAAAALFAALGLVALALLAARPRSMPLVTAAYLLVVGLCATASRGGLLAFGAGLVVLTVLGRGTPVLRPAAPVLVGAAVAGAALVPALPASAPAHPALAAAGLLAGWAVAAGLSRLPRFGATAAVALLVAGIVTVLAVRPGLDDRVAVNRLSLASSGRSEAAQAAAHLIAQRPLTGVGPGLAAFAWTNNEGYRRVARFAHDEYLQVQVELGAIGSVLLLALLASLVLVLLRGRPARAPAARPLATATARWAGAVAACAALAAHSGLDYLWHLPVVPLCAGLLAGLAAPPWAHGHPGPDSPNKEEA